VLLRYQRSNRVYRLYSGPKVRFRHRANLGKSKVMKRGSRRNGPYAHVGSFRNKQRRNNSLQRNAVDPVPKVEPYHSLRDSVPPPVDRNFINQNPLLLCSKVVALHNFDVTVVPLTGFSDFDEPSMLFWNAPFWFLTHGSVP